MASATAARAGAEAAATAPDSLVQCPDCGAEMDDPRVLRCLHTACLECLRRAHEGKAIKCPLCGFATPCVSADQLPRNTFVEAEHRRRSGLRSCRNCGRADAAVHCGPCASLLCVACDESIHSNVIFRKHARSVLGAVGAGSHGSDESGAQAALRAALEAKCLPVGVPCHTHGSFILSAFCTDCTVSVCECCTRDNHRGHGIKPLATALRAVHEAGPKAHATFEEVSRHVSGGVREVAACERDVHSAAVKCSREINATFDRLVEQINARRQFLLGRVADAAEKKTELLKAQRASLEQVHGSVRRSAELSRALTQQPQDFTLPELIDIGSHVGAYCDFVRSQRLDVAPCVDPGIAVSFGGASSASVNSASGGASTRRGSVFGPHSSATAEDDIAAAIDGFGSVTARSTVERQFDFERVGDHQGVLYYLGTSRGIKLYENPMTLGRARVASSSLGYGRPEHVVAAEPADFCTHNEAYAWVSVELEAPVCVTHYALCHDTYDREAHFLRSWELQGWRPAVAGAGGDGAWDVLAAHHADKSLTERTPAAAWAVKGCRSEGYRRFRIVQTGENSHGNHYLMLSAFELYGTLLG